MADSENQPNPPSIRQLVDDALGDDELSNLCQDEFPTVYNQFVSGQTKDLRIRLLVAHVKLQREVPKLLNAIERINPNAYAEYQRKLRASIPPKVFISYIHDSQLVTKRILLDRVLQLADRLRLDGIDCNIDQYQDLPAEGWSQWMQHQLERADFILVVCTEQYDRRFRSRESYEQGQDATWQGGVIVDQLYHDRGQNLKFIPIIFTPEDFRYIPDPLLDANHYELQDRDGDGYELLYRYLTDQLLADKPQIEKLKALPLRPRRQSFLSGKIFSNLPDRDRSKFIGREEKIQDLLKLISSSCTQFIHVIQGIGGIGKTSLALEVAYRCLEARKNNTVDRSTPIFDAFIFTSSKETQFTLFNTLLPRPEKEPTLVDIFRAISETLEEGKIVKSPEERQQQEVYEALSKQSTLLIIDNMETLSEDERNKILKFINSVPPYIQIQVIITTRQPLSTQSYSVFLEGLNQQETAELIEIESKDKNITIVDSKKKQDIFNFLGGHPLAIKNTIGKYVAGQKLEDILDSNANQSTDIMEFCFKKEVEPLRGTVAHKLLMAMTFFKDSPREDALIQVVGVAKRDQPKSEIEDGLVKLTKLCLIAAKEKDRYFIEATTCQYAIAELWNIDPDIHHMMEARWLEHYLEFTKKYGGDDWGNWKEQYAPLKEQWQNIESVLSVYNSRRDWHNLLKIWEHIDRYVDLNRYWQKRLDWWSILAENIDDPGIKVKALSEKAWTLILKGTTLEEYTLAKQLLDEAWANSGNASDLVRADIANHLAVLLENQNSEEALRWLDRESEILDRCQLPENDETRTRHEIQNLYHRAVIDRLRNNLDVAKAQFEKVMDSCGQIGWSRLRNYAQNDLADILIEQGELERAEEILVDGIDFAISMEEERRIALHHASFARLYFQKFVLTRSSSDISNSEYIVEMEKSAEEARTRFDKQGMIPELNKLNELLNKLQELIDYQPSQSN